MQHVTLTLDFITITLGALCWSTFHTMLYKLDYVHGYVVAIFIWGRFCTCWFWYNRSETQPPCIHKSDYRSFIYSVIYLHVKILDSAWRHNDSIYSLWCFTKVVKCLISKSPVYIFPQPTSCPVGLSGDKPAGLDVSWHAKTSLKYIMIKQSIMFTNLLSMFSITCLVFQCCCLSTGLLSCEAMCPGRSGWKLFVSLCYFSSLSSISRLSADDFALHVKLPDKVMLVFMTDRACSQNCFHLHLTYYSLCKHLILVLLCLSPPGVKYPSVQTFPGNTISK